MLTIKMSAKPERCLQRSDMFSDMEIENSTKLSSRAAFSLNIISYSLVSHYLPDWETGAAFPIFVSFRAVDFCSLLSETSNLSYT